MTINLVDEHGGKWFAREPRQQQRPVVQVRAVTVVAHSLVVVLDDLNERTHNLREANNTDKHIANTDQNLVDRNGVVVAVANRGQCRQREIADDDDLGQDVVVTIHIVPRLAFFDFFKSVPARVVFVVAVVAVALIRHAVLEDLVKLVGRDERVLISDVVFRVDALHQEPPEAGNDVRDHEYNNDESENLVRVHHHVLSLDSVSTRRFVVVRLDKTFDSTNVQEFDQFRQPCQPNQPRIRTVIEHEVERERGNEIEEHPSGLKVTNREQFVAADACECFLVLILLEKVEEEVEGEADEDDVVDEHEDVACLNPERNVEYSGQAGVADDEENGRVKGSLPLTVHADNEVFRLDAVAERKFWLVFAHDFVLVGL